MSDVGSEWQMESAPPNQNKNIQKNSDLTDWFILLNIYWTNCWTRKENKWLNARSKNSVNTRIVLNFLLNFLLKIDWMGGNLHWISLMVQPLNSARSVDMMPEHWRRRSARYPKTSWIVLKTYWILKVETGGRSWILHKISERKQLNFS